MRDGAEAEDRSLRVAEVRRRAVAGVAVLGARGVAMRALNFVGYVVLARLLGPADLGVVALGLTILFSGWFFVDAGIGATLIRQAEPPTREDLQTVVFFQLGVALLFAAVIAAIAEPLGEVGWIAAVMVAALPVTAFRTPGVVLLERDLLYHRIAVIEVAEVVAFQACAITAVVAGLGVWGVAAAGVLKTVVGTAMMLWLGPVGLVAPVLHRRRLRSMLGFAGRFQAIGLVNLLRDQVLNIGIAAVAGTAVLGLWSMAYRLLQIPVLLFSTLWQVSFPAMARLVQEGEDARPLVERAVGIGTVATGALLVPLVAGAPAAVPAIFGPGWDGVSSVVMWSCLGLIFGGPISVATAGYLFAAGAAGTLLRSAVLHSIAWGAVTFSLLPAIGVTAVGVGYLVAAVLEGVILGRATSRDLHTRYAGNLAMPAFAAVAASAGGWAIATAASPTLVVACASAALAEALFVVTLLAVRRGTLIDTFRLAGRAAATARARPV